MNAIAQQTLINQSINNNNKTTDVRRTRLLICDYLRSCNCYQNQLFTRLCPFFYFITPHLQCGNTQ